MSLNEVGVAPVSVLCSSRETWFGMASMNETAGMVVSLCLFEVCWRCRS